MHKVASATPFELAHAGSMGSDGAGPTSAELAPKTSSSGKLLKAMTADLKDILATSGKGSRSPDRCMTGRLLQHHTLLACISTDDEVPIRSSMLVKLTERLQKKPCSPACASK